MLLGVYVLGGLRGEEEAGVAGHLDRCDRCRAEYEELAEIRPLLDLLADGEGEVAGMAARPPAVPDAATGSATRDGPAPDAPAPAGPAPAGPAVDAPAPDTPDGGDCAPDTAPAVTADVAAPAADGRATPPRSSRDRRQRGRLMSRFIRLGRGQAIRDPGESPAADSAATPSVRRLIATPPASGW
jgi:hypothetical protein